MKASFHIWDDKDYTIKTFITILTQFAHTNLYKYIL